jgi:hypothetical protein
MSFLWQLVLAPARTNTPAIKKAGGRALRNRLVVGDKFPSPWMPTFRNGTAGKPAFVNRVRAARREKT